MPVLIPNFERKRKNDPWFERCKLELNLISLNDEFIYELFPKGLSYSSILQRVAPLVQCLR